MSSDEMDVPNVAGEEKEAVQRLRGALRNPHGTTTENRSRLLSAWQTLRSVATSPGVQENSQKRRRKRSQLESDTKKKKKRKEGEKVEKGEQEEDQKLHEAARLGQADRVKELVSGGCKVSAKDKLGYSALHWASLYGHFEVVRVLLSLGAADGKRINRTNDAGNTALHLACLGRHAQVAVELQMYKPDEYLMNVYDQSPVSLGLRELAECFENMRHLDAIQASRATSHEQLLSESLDWQMEQNVATDGRWKNFINKNSLRGWEDYEAAWMKFSERFAGTSGTEDRLPSRVSAAESGQDGAPGHDRLPSRNSAAEIGKDGQFGHDRLPSGNSAAESGKDGQPGHDRLPSRDAAADSGGGAAAGHGLIHFQDVPWPVTRMQTSTGRHRLDDRVQSEDRLLLAELGVTGLPLRSLIQRERLRWHPDKFTQLFGHHLELEEKSSILAGVQTVCQLLNSLADATAKNND